MRNDIVSTLINEEALEELCYHGLLSDREICSKLVSAEDDEEFADLLKLGGNESIVIYPFVETHYRPKEKAASKGKISYGLTSFGYDLRLGRKYKIFHNLHSKIIDPKHFDSDSFIDHEGDSCIIPPNSFALGESLEYLQIPRDMLAICIGKSTYARCGIITPITPVEPEWKGKLTIEISNTTPLPAKVYSEEGICQLLFFKSPYAVSVSYKDKQGKYQNQTGLTLPKVPNE